MSNPPATPPYGSDDVAVLYERYAPVVYRRAMRILANPEEAHDAVQEVFIVLLRKADSFRGEADVLTWIYRIATNHCLNRLRRRKVEVRTAAKMQEERKLASAAGGQEPLLGHRAALVDLLEETNPRHVQILFHRYHDEMTQSEIADVMKISERGVRKALKRFHDHARVRLLARAEAQMEVA